MADAIWTGPAVAVVTLFDDDGAAAGRGDRGARRPAGRRRHRGGRGGRQHR